MRRALPLLSLVLLAAAPARAAETAYLYEQGPALRIVALDDVGTQLAGPLPITGLGAGDGIAGIDLRPADGKLYALTTNTATNPDHAELYRLEVGEDSVSATSIGIPDFVPSGAIGVAFVEATDRLRVVSTTGLNLRLNPETGVIAGSDTAPAFVAGDENEGSAPSISGIAMAGRTLLAIAGTERVLARIGGADGDPPSPNAGNVFTIGATGLSAGLTDSLDVSPAGNLWWLRSGFFNSVAWRLDPATGRPLRGVPLDLVATGFAVLPSARVVLGSASAGYYGEGDGSATFEVLRSDSTAGETTVPYTVTDRSAGVAATSGTVTFAEGETTKPLAVAIPQDAAAEGTQFFTVAIGEPAGSRHAGAVGGNQELTAIVTDDDAPPAAGPSPAATVAPVADTVRPRLRITGVPRRTLTRAQLLRGFRVRVLASETASLDVSLRANPRRGVFASAYELSLFSRRYGRSAFTRTVRVRPSRRLVGRLNRRVRLRLTFDAIDVAGNRTTVNRTISVRR